MGAYEELKKFMKAKQAPQFRVGDKVTYRVPVDINGPRDYQWVERVGLVEMIDYAHHWALIVPENETAPRVWVNLTYVQAVAS